MECELVCWFLFKSPSNRAIEKAIHEVIELFWPIVCHAMGTIFYLEQLRPSRFKVLIHSNKIVSSFGPEEVIVPKNNADREINIWIT